ncbi:MAG: hypothetical protein AMXMBFR78_02990 [Rubrivivax sp.]
MVPCIKKTTLAAAVAFLAASAAQAADLDRLRALLDATPAGGWVQANTGSFSSAFPTGSDAVNIQSYSDPGLIVGAWSSFAWNTDTASLMLWGGGHANYAGNEMYIWNAASGAWSRGSLPSKLSSSWFISDNSAPQSAHTYDNQLYLPVNKMFLTLGGAAFPSGGNFQAEVGGAVVRTGPWMFDPSRADPSKVGGSSGSGFDPATPGGNMWINRGTSYGGTLPQSFVEGSTAYRGEGGRDVVYVEADAWQSGWPFLYRYTVGDVRKGETDTWELVGRNSYTGAAFQGAAAIDSRNNLFVRTAGGSWGHDLIVWDLSKASAAAPVNNVTISLVDEAGAAFDLTKFYGLDYDSNLERFFVWDANALGDVYSFAAEYDASGQLSSTWTASRIASATAAHPDTPHSAGVLGKWQYVEELDAYLALAAYEGGDAGVWLYKPFDVTTPVPELPVHWMLAIGLALLGARHVRAPKARFAAPGVA